MALFERCFWKATGHVLECVGTMDRSNSNVRRPFCYRFLTGADEHGQKIANTAEREGITPQALVDKCVVKFKELDVHRHASLILIQMYFMRDV